MSRQPLTYAQRRDAQELVKRWELADERDRWRHTRERKPSDAFRNSETRVERPVYSTPQSTIDAFWYLVQVGDAKRLDAWLLDRPQDAAFLIVQRRLKEAAK